MALSGSRQRRGPHVLRRPSLQLLDLIEMPVEGDERHLMLNAERCDPEIVFRNRRAFSLQGKSEPGVYGGRGLDDVQDQASGDQSFNFGEILDSAPGVQSAV